MLFDELILATSGDALDEGDFAGRGRSREPCCQSSLPRRVCGFTFPQSYSQEVREENGGYRAGLVSFFHGVPHVKVVRSQSPSYSGNTLGAMALGRV